MKKIFKKIKNVFTVPGYLMIVKSKLGFYNNVNDKDYLKKLFKSRMGYSLNLNNPTTFNEKLQWLKLYDRKPEYTIMVDKYKARDYIAKKIGEEYLVPLLGVWDNCNDIDFNTLPNQFVLKCNHNSGIGLCICKDKSKLDINNVKKELQKGLDQDYYLPGREWPYKNVPRKIICEEYLGDNPNDYKFFCFNGRVEYILVCSDRFDSLKETFFDRNWNIAPFKRPGIDIEKTLEKPNNLEKMIKLAEILSVNIPFLRADFYEVDNKIYFGELTFFPASGFSGFEPEEWDLKLGELIKLPKNNTKNMINYE